MLHATSTALVFICTRPQHIDFFSLIAAITHTHIANNYCIQVLKHGPQHKGVAVNAFIDNRSAHGRCPAATLEPHPPPLLMPCRCRRDAPSTPAAARQSHCCCCCCCCCACVTALERCAPSLQQPLLRLQPPQVKQPLLLPQHQHAHAIPGRCETHTINSQWLHLNGNND
jgi:hypothetical protein